MSNDNDKMDKETFVNFIGQCRPLLMEQLQKDVANCMYEKKVLTDQEYSNISSVSREKQIIALLDLLPLKNRSQINTFVDYLVHWYNWIPQKACTKLSDTEKRHKEVQRILDYAEVPRLPTRYVRRKDAYFKLCDCLHNVKPNEYVLVYGMRGCGKTTLISDVLRDSSSLVKDIFQEHVYWLSVGRLSTPEKKEEIYSPEELTIQQELIMKMITQSDFGAPSLPMDTKSARKYLRDKLRKSELEGCLLVLDDVPSSSFIETLDIGCKILVTTDKKDIMDGTNKTVHQVKLSDGFTPEETLKLFALNLNQEDLPSIAKTRVESLHSFCKGFPLSMSLISSQIGEYKEDVLVNTDRWNVYYTELKKKNVHGAIGNDKNRQQRLESLYNAIQMSIDSLDVNLKEKYHDFALFMDDVNIRPEVLGTLWDLPKKDVEDIMREYERKCLAVRAWNKTTNTYVFCVHDLLLDYLKRLLDESQTRELHKKLIKAYQKKFGSDFINFPVDDNYIFLYIGHHLKEANMVDEFPQLYFDFRFIEKKITNIGAADLLLDFKKYEEDIVKKNCDDNTAFQDFVNFIKHVGACKATSDCDIIQFALCEPKDSVVYKRATQYVKVLQSSDRPTEREYFQLVTDMPRDNTFPVRQYVREKVEVATFADNANVVIFASPDAVIKMISLEVGAVENSIAKFEHHTRGVTRLQWAKNTFFFLSGSNDCTVAVWYFDYDSIGSSSATEKPRTPSPKLRQHSYFDWWRETRVPGQSPVAVLKGHTNNITCASFYENSNRTACKIVTAGEDFQVIVWRIEWTYGDESKPISHRNFRQVFVTKSIINNCVFGDDDTVLCASAEKVFIYKCSTKELLFETSLDCEIMSMATIPNKPFITTLVLDKDLFRVFELRGNRLATINTTASRQCETKCKRESKHVCWAISWDGKYTAIATSDHTIRIKDTWTGQRIVKLTEINGDLRGLCWSRENSLLAWYRNIPHIKTWRLGDKLTTREDNRLKLLKFDAAWIPNGKNETDTTLVTAAVTNSNDIKIFFDEKEHETIKTRTGTEIGDVSVCPTSGNIVYSTVSGQLFYVNLSDPTPVEIMSVRCVRTSKLKLFLRSRGGVLMAFLMENSQKKVSLVGLPWSESLNKLPVNTNLVEYDDETNVPIVDFYVNSTTDQVYVMRNNYSLNIYDANTAILLESRKLENDFATFDARYCDISVDFASIAYGIDNELRAIFTWENDRKLWLVFEKHAEICRFNSDGKYLAVGFSDGTFRIYDCANGNVKLSNEERSRVSGKVLEFYWSSFEPVLMVIQDTEIRLYDIKRDCKLRAVLYLKVDKLISNKTFDGSVTVDSAGQLVVIRHPALKNSSHFVQTTSTNR